MRIALVVFLLGTLLGCVTLGDADQPIATQLVSAPQPAQRLVVVLPGFGDGVRALERTGIVAAVQSAWPDSDVVLAELTYAYYQEGKAPRRLHEEIIAPARRRGYSEVWLCGASMGGMGVLLYDLSYPRNVDGIVLLAPYLGERALLEEISAAGGLSQWNPGARRELGPDTWQRELWRHLQGWMRDPALSRNVWMAYGEADRLRMAMPVLAPALRAENILVRPGAHSWSVWTPAMREILTLAGRREISSPPSSLP